MSFRCSRICPLIAIRQSVDVLREYRKSEPHVVWVVDLLHSDCRGIPYDMVVYKVYFGENIQLSRACDYPVVRRLVE